MSKLTSFLKFFKSLRMPVFEARSVGLFCFFVVISTMFWCFLTFNENMQRDIQVEFEITEVPRDVTFIDDVPQTITVTVADRALNMIKYQLFPRKVSIRFADYTMNNTSTLNLTTQQLRGLVTRVLGSSSRLINMMPATMTLAYTDLPGKKVPIVLDLQVDAGMQYVLNGEVIKQLDSVSVYGDSKTLSEIEQVYTYHVVLNGLTETVERKISIQPIKNVRIEPEYITVMVPIERLIQSKQVLQVEVRNQPDGMKLILFPSLVEVSYLIPQSLYMKDRKDVRHKIVAVVDYNDLDTEGGSYKLPVHIESAPAVYRNLQLTQDSVEFILEKH